MNYLKYFLVISLLFTVLSCKKFIEINPPSTQLIGQNVFSSDATATAAISAVYYKCAFNNFASGGINSVTYLAGIAADELTAYSTNLDLLQLNQNNLLPSNVYTSSIWTDTYNVIYLVNTVIEGLDKSKAITPALKTQLKGEALFLRGFAHLYLTTLFGDVPYITGTDYRVNTSVQRLAKSAVLTKITEDLNQSISLLDQDYSYSGGERIRPNKWAAYALLARVYLYQQDWHKAEQAATEVISKSSMYQLTALNEVFLKNSAEAIWQIKPVSGSLNTTEGALFILTGRPTSAVALRTDFLAGFEPGDLREQLWIGNFTNASGSWYFPYKYKIKTGGTPLNEYSMVLRLGEQYLIRSEAKAEQDDRSGAITDLDAIRFRAGLPKIADINPEISKEDLLLAIQQERRMELFCEWGHRWIDLKRTGTIDDVLSTKKNGWKNTDALFPVPANELLVDPNLTQNDGYN